MKTRGNTTFLLSCVFMAFNSLLGAQDKHKEDPHYEWFEADNVAVEDDGIYVDTNKGMMKLNVVEYDRVNNQYKVLCSCLKRRGLDMGEALSLPYEDVPNYTQED